MLIIRHKDMYLRERKYIYDLIFCEFWNISYKVVIENRKDLCIECEGKSLLIDDGFFQMNEKLYLEEASLPLQPLGRWKVNCPEILECLTNPDLPMIYGQAIKENKYFIGNDEQVQIGIDIFGSAFFMLTRYEEVVKKDRDEHDRFPAKASLAYQEGFLERPIINEYIELLWYAMQKLWPELERKKRNFQIVPTHDVDAPFEMAFLSPYQILRTLAGDLIKRHSLNKFINRGYSACKVKGGRIFADAYYTFDLIMDISEENNLKSRFYMMEAQGLSSFDGNYDLEHFSIIRLMKYIVDRGHEIGIHPSYVSYKNATEIKSEVQHLKNVLKSNNLRCDEVGGRQHFLRWSSPETWQYYEDAGITYDTTLSFADHIGFRCGICYEYSVFNVRTRKMLKLKEKPLVIMECSALDERYMDLSSDIALKRFLELKAKCKKYEGDFVVLWHNSRFITQNEIDLYKFIIK